MLHAFSLSLGAFTGSSSTTCVLGIAQLTQNKDCTDILCVTLEKHTPALPMGLCPKTIGRSNRGPTFIRLQGSKRLNSINSSAAWLFSRGASTRSVKLTGNRTGNGSVSCQPNHARVQEENNRSRQMNRPCQGAMLRSRYCAESARLPERQAGLRSRRGVSLPAPGAA